MADDPAFVWAQRRSTAAPAHTRRPPSGGPSPTEARITLREAHHRFGVPVGTLRSWASKGAVDAVSEASPSGPRWMVTPESVAHRLSRNPRRSAPPSKGARKESVREGATGPTADGTAMLVPRDAWDRMMDQLGNLHEAGLMLAEARERAAKAETEAAFLRERLAEMRAERAATPQVTEPPPTAAPGAWERLRRRLRGSG